MKIRLSIFYGGCSNPTKQQRNEIHSWDSALIFNLKKVVSDGNFILQFQGIRKCTLGSWIYDLFPDVK